MVPSTNHGSPPATLVIDATSSPGRSKCPKGLRDYEQALERLYIEKVTRKARREGVQEGHKEGQAAFLLRLLARRFGALPEALTARVMSASREELERWGDRILDAASLDDVFAAS